MSITADPVAKSEAKAPRLKPPPRWTAADLLRRLGGVGPHRVRLHPSPGTATEDDVVLARAHGGLCELIDGTLVEKPMGVPESFLASLLIQFLGPFVRQHRLGVTTAADGMYRMSQGNVREPDVSFTQRSRLSTPLPQVGGWCPDLCVEVLSPDNTAEEMARKRAEYFGSGCRLVWEIDPRKRTAVVYTAPADGRMLTPQDALDGGGVVPGFTLPLAELFAAYDEALQASP